ncbi:cupredoxin domain-containing protein [Candidatus Woesebacteria bacterium]|nr:cupredoxin domain-containing protein [Candidatus Woesebacteria bacterium]
MLPLISHALVQSTYYKLPHKIQGGEQAMQNKYIVPIAIGVVVVVALVAMKFSGFGSAPGESAMEPTNVPAEVVTEAMMEKDTTTEPSTSDAMMEENTITVEGKNFSFAPSTITVKKGEKVTILFKNMEGFHDFVIDELDVKTTQINEGEEESVEFTPMEAGEYEFYCSVGKHREMGMVGTLIVE